MNGRLEYNGSAWMVRDLKPHVSIRFKDVFRSIPIGDVPPFLLKDRPDMAADLEWFMARYPLEASDQTARHLAASADEYRARMARLEEMRAPDYTPLTQHGFKDGEAPEPYQLRAADMLRESGRLLLLDDVGLGKTVSALAAVSDGWGLPAAVVVQPHLSAQWVREYIERFTHLRAVEIKTTVPHDLPSADIYIFRYSNIAGWVDYLPKLRLKTAIFDEIQELRHGENTQKGRGAKALCDCVDHRMGLTATPIYNYGSEIWNVVEFIAPGALGTWFEFITNWCTAHGTHWIVKEPAALGAYLLDEGIALRRTNEDPEVSKTLPPLNRTVVEVGWDEGDAVSNRELQKRLALRILNGAFHERGQAARELDLMLRQETGIAKARAVAAYVRTLIEAGECVLLGGWHREVYRIWMDCLSDLSPVMFTGSESQSAKAKAKQAFLSGDTRLMIMSLRSGAGLDGLQTNCAHVVYGEFDWSPQVHTQFTGRVRRRGQTRPVTAHFLHVDGGSDPVIMSTLGLKASQSHGILNPFVTLQAATPQDDSRMRALAKSILEEVQPNGDD